MNKTEQFKIYGLVTIVLGSLLAMLFLLDPFDQNPTYHSFSDQNHFIGIPNFHNVTSNIFFTVFALIGLFHFQKNKESQSLSWLVFLVGVFLVAPGSAYYHWSPSNQTLIWDRIPMVIAFMGLTSFTITEAFSKKYEKIFLATILLIGFYSIFHWVHFKDLRVYYWVQLSPIITVLYAAVFFSTPSLIPRYLISAVVLYLAAKLTENKDDIIFETLGYSGHSIKHILAALTVFCLILMMKKRNINVAD